MIGLVSSYREGALAAEAVRSLLTVCHRVHVAEGPIGPETDGPETDWAQFKKDGRVIVTYGQWQTDAEKRTYLLERTRRYGPNCWGVVLDGDEILVHGEYLPSMIEHAQEADRLNGTTSYNVVLRLLEWDGSVSKIPARVLRFDVIEQYLLSSYNFTLKGGHVSPALGNQPLRLAGEEDLPPKEGEFQKRRPLPGEPFILHRSFLRSPRRKARRQNAAEADGFTGLVRESGLAVVQGEKASEGGVRLWLPTK